MPNRLKSPPTTPRDRACDACNNGITKGTYNVKAAHHLSVIMAASPSSRSSRSRVSAGIRV